MRRRISQREAVRMRKEIDTLRSFLRTMRYSVGYAAKMEVGRVALCDRARGRIEGLRAVAPHTLLVAVIDGNDIVCYAHVPPSETTNA